jgi:predicted PurR-regulated permease PerM
MVAPRAPDSGATAASRGPVVTRLLAVIAVILVLEALRIARPVVLPLVAAVFVLMVAWPLEPWLERRAPRWVALGATFLVVLGALALFLAALTWCAQLAVDRVQGHQQELEALRRQAESYAARFGIDMSSSAAPGGGGGSGLVRTGLRTAYETVGFIVLAIAFIALGLGEVGDFREKIQRRLSRRQSAELLRIAGEIATAFRRYFAAKTLTSVLTGIASGLLALALGLDLAVVWGFTAFLLEYVPTIGSIIAIAPPTLFAFIQFDGLTRPLVTLASFTVLQITMGNIIDPRIEGRVLAFSPVIILLSITLWGWLWGVAGALLGVPMTVAITIACQHFESTRWIADLITDVDAKATGNAVGKAAEQAAGRGTEE